MADFSLSRLLRRFIPRPRYASWRIARAETFRLVDVLDRRADTTGRYIYMVALEQRRIYVGQCTRGLRQRIMEHIGAGTPIGAFMSTLPPGEWIVDVVHIDGNLRAAELYYIDQFEPRYNRQHRGPS